MFTCFFHFYLKVMNLTFAGCAKIFKKSSGCLEERVNGFVEFCFSGTIDMRSPLGISHEKGMHCGCFQDMAVVRIRSAHTMNAGLRKLT